MALYPNGFEIPSIRPAYLASPKQYLTKDEEYEILDKVGEGDGDAWDQFMGQSGIPGAAYHALRYVRYKGHVAEFDESVSFAFIGVQDALERFDLSAGTRFWTYAAARVTGAIVDGYRSIDWVPRLARNCSREIDRYMAQLNIQRHQLCADQVAEYFDLTLEKASHMIKQSEVKSFERLDDLWDVVCRNPYEDQASHIMQVADTSSLGQMDAGFDAAQRADFKQALRGAVRTHRDMVVIELYYYQGLSMKQAASILWISESRFCQIHKDLITRLKSTLKAHAEGIAWDSR